MNTFIAIDHRSCTGCKTCEVVCSLHHFGECNPMRSAIRVIRKEKNGLVFALPLVCQQCKPAPCVEACPTEALTKNGIRGTLRVDKDKCTACEICVQTCPAGCIFIDPVGEAAIACDLCGGQPQCILTCHANCLSEVSISEADDTQNVQYLARILEKEVLQRHSSVKGVG
ncbi:MAG: 4Fe-4S dicluster domain-containing protein [Bacillota bacterium]